MKKTLTLIFLFIFFITGCSDTSNVKKDDEQEKDPTSDILLKFKIRFFVKKHNNFYSNLLNSKANVK